MAMREILSEMLESIGMGYGIAAEYKDVFVQDMCNIAMNDPFVTQMFDSKLMERSGGRMSLASQAGGQVEVSGEGERGLIKSLPMPVYGRKRDHRVKVKLNMILPNKFKEFLVQHYVNDVDITFLEISVDAHPEAAASRRIETDIIMHMLRAEGADALRRPSNGYDYSIIDTGGDWRGHLVRGHHGVHSDAPLLDKRDQAREVRRRLTLETIGDTDAICRHKMDECEVTAPFMMSVHVSYFVPHAEVCSAMAKRGMMLYVGSMFLPDCIGDFQGYYEDMDYSYIVEDSKESGVLAMYIPPELRKGTYKYIMPKEGRYVRFRFAEGEARHYVHKLSVLQEYLEAKTIIVKADSGNFIYDYSIIRRVGSLVYFSFRLRDEVKKAHIVEMEYSVVEPKDGFLIEINSNLLEPIMFDFGQKTTVFSPRFLFTPVAGYALTQTKNERWEPPQAISYTRSAASGIMFNGLPVQPSVDMADTKVISATALAAFSWGFDRYRLISARVGEMFNDDIVEKVEIALTKYLAGTVDFSQVFGKLRSMAITTIVDKLTQYAMQHVSASEDLYKLYESINREHSPGGIKITDTKTLYPHLKQIKDMVNVRVDKVLVQEVSIPCYEVIEPANPTYAVYDEVSLETVTTIEDNDNAEQKRIVQDWITVVTAQESEAAETARAVYTRVIDPFTRTIPNRIAFRQNVAAPAVVLEYESGQLNIIEVSGIRFVRGTEDYNRYLTTYKGQRAVYAEKYNNVTQYGTGVVRADGVLISDRRARTDGTFHAFLDPKLEVQNAVQLTALFDRVDAHGGFVKLHDKLVNGVAGCGKTTSQVQLFMQLIAAGKHVLLLAAKVTARDELIARLSARGFDAVDKVFTVDGFLMNPLRWQDFDHVIIDEVLTCHGGQVYAVKMLTGACVTGYGDSFQGGWFSVSRFYESKVENRFPWLNVERVFKAYRTPQDFEEYLKNEALYGPEYYTVSPVEKSMVAAVTVPGFESQLNGKLLFKLMGLSQRDSLHVLVYMRREVPQIRPKLIGFDSDGITVGAIEDIELSTIGASQGGDFDNVVVLKLSNQENPLYMDRSQTIIAMTRHKRKWMYISVGSVKPSLLEMVLGSMSFAASLSVVHNKLFD